MAIKFDLQVNACPSRQSQYTSSTISLDLKLVEDTCEPCELPMCAKFSETC